MVPYPGQIGQNVSGSRPQVLPRVSTHRLHGPHLVGMPEIKALLEQDFSLIRKVTKVQILKIPSIALLNANLPKTPKHTRKLIHFILLGAKLTIAKDWKEPKVSVKAATCKISWIMSQEKLSSILHNTKAKFEVIWEPWAKYMGISLIPGVQL